MHLSSKGPARWLPFAIAAALLVVSAFGMLLDHPRAVHQEDDSDDRLRSLAFLAASRPPGSEEEAPMAAEVDDGRVAEPVTAVLSATLQEEERVRIFASGLGLPPGEQEGPSEAETAVDPAEPVEESPAPPPPAPEPTRRPAPTATAAPPPPPPAALAQAAPALTVLEQQLLDAHQAERARVGLAPLRLDAQLVAVARQRAADMAARGYFGHYSPEGHTVFTLLAAAGVSFTAAAENIARNNFAASQAVSTAMSGFMASGSHRANVLGTYTRIGVGMAQRGDTWYFAVVFAAP